MPSVEERRKKNNHQRIQQKAHLSSATNQTGAGGAAAAEAGGDAAAPALPGAGGGAAPFPTISRFYGAHRFQPRSRGGAAAAPARGEASVETNKTGDDFVGAAAAPVLTEAGGGGASAEGAGGVAAQHGHHHVVEALLQEGADPNSLTTDGNTLLHLAVFEDDLERVKALCSALDIKEFIDIKNKQGITPLYDAASKGMDDIVSVLLQKGANPQEKCAENDVTPLHVAAFTGHSNVVNALLQEGADPNSLIKDGRTALILASGYIRTKEMGNKTDEMRMSTVEALINSGASLTLRDNKSKTAESCTFNFRRYGPPEFSTDLQTLKNKHKAFDNLLNNPSTVKKIIELVKENTLHPNYFSGTHTALTAYLSFTDPGKMDQEVVKSLITSVSINKKTGGLLRQDPLTILLGKLPLNMEVAKELADSLKQSGHSLDPYLALTTPSAKKFRSEYTKIDNPQTWTQTVGGGGGGSKASGHTR